MRGTILPTRKMRNSLSSQMQHSIALMRLVHKLQRPPPIPRPRRPTVIPSHSQPVADECPAYQSIRQSNSNSENNIEKARPQRLLSTI